MKHLCRSRLSRRTVIGIYVAALGGGVLTAPAAVAQDRSKDDVLTSFESLVVQGRTGYDTRTGKVLNLDPLRIVNNLTDAVTGRILGPGTARMSVQSDGPAGDLYSCIKSGDTRRLTAYPASNRYISTDKGSIQFQYFAYRMAQARRVNGHGFSTQWEVCSKGGADLDSGRLRRVGTGMALDDLGSTRRIGYAWQTGKTPEDYSLELGFKVEKGPASINASITQNPADRLLGSFRAPYDSFMNNYDRQAVNAWWQDNCIGRWYGCLRNSGSQDFQGVIAHGLWEFPKGDEPPVVAFYYTPYASL